MKGIILGIIPSSANFVEVKLPLNVEPKQFDAIMNRIKLEFYSNIQPKMKSSDSDFGIVTFNEDEANSIINESPAIMAVEDLIRTIGNPIANPDWASRFWREYGNGNPIVGQGLLVIRNNCDSQLEDYLKEKNLAWLLDFVRATRR